MRKSDLVIAGLVLTGCSVVAPPHALSDDRAGERVTLQIQEEQPTDVQSLAPTALGASEVVSAAAGVAIDLIGAAIQSEADKYSAQYSASASGEFFSDAPKVDCKTVVAKQKATGFTLTRETSKGEAMKLQFCLKQSANGDGFLIRLTSADFKRSKAKVVDTSWSTHYWTRVPLLYGLVLYDAPQGLGLMDLSDPTVDVAVTATMEVIWIDDKQTAHRDKILDNSTVVVGRFKLDKPGKQDDFASKLVGWIPTPPVSYSKSGPWGTGLYTLTLTVTESNDFGKYIAKAAEKLKANKETIINNIVK